MVKKWEGVDNAMTIIQRADQLGFVGSKKKSRYREMINDKYKITQ
jgi:hypothetical protein